MSKTEPWPSALFYSQRAKFFRQVKRYYDLFDEKQIKMIIFDDFEKDNASTYREVLEFLEVNPSFKPKFEKVNANRKSKLPRVGFLFKTVFFTKITELPMFILPQPLVLKYKNFRNSIFRHIFFKVQPRPSMDPELRKHLMKKFKPEVKRLSKLVDRDLVSLWGCDSIE